MTAIVPNIAKGKIARYAMLPEANDALFAIPLKSSGLESIATLRDYDDVAAILAASNDEGDNGMSRTAALTGVTVTVDDTNDWVLVDCNDPSFTPSAMVGIGAILIAYDPDTTGGTDSTLIPLFVDDAFALTTPASGTVTYQVASGGFAKSA